MGLQTYADNCNYHHENQPAWVCSGCNISLCEECIPFGHSSHWGRTGPRCPLCNKNLLFRGGTEEASPFWTQLPHFFAYPLHANSLGMIALISFSGIVLPWFSFLSIILGLFLLVITVKYSFKIIEERAMNELVPPSISDVLEKDEHHLFFKLVVVMIILYGGAYFFSGGNQTVFNILNGIITFILPAVTIILAIEKSIFTTVNPLTILSFILRIGWAYLLVWFCYQIVSSGPGFIFFLLPESLSLSISVPFVIAVSLYFWFVANCMLGYTVYQYQDTLGHAGALHADDYDEVTKAEFDKKRGLSEAYISIRENNVDGARKMLRPLLDQYKNDRELHDFYHKILTLMEDKESLKNHADFYIQFLIDAGSIKAAAKVYDATLAKLPTYQPDNINGAYQIAKVFNDTGKKKNIVKILNNLHKINISDPMLPSAYFLLAKTYSEYMNKDEQALKIVDFLLDRFPQTEIRAELIQYKKILSKIV